MSTISKMNPLEQALVKADLTRQLNQVCPTIINSMRENNTLTLQKIETIFRKNNGWTYLIAREREDHYSPDVKFEVPNEEGKEKKYYLWMTTKDKKKAMNELLQESTSYEENYKKLADAGFPRLDDKKPVHKQVHGGAIETKSGLTVNLEGVEQDQSGIIAKLLNALVFTTTSSNGSIFDDKRK